MEKESVNSLTKMRGKIRRQVRIRGQYSHNLISSYLRYIDAHYGADEANKAIRDFKLEELFGIAQERA